MGIVILALAAIGGARPEDRKLWGDEGTYVAMTASLAHDGDLAFDDSDAQFLLDHPDDPSPTVILQQTHRGITYSKPVLYALISAPLFKIMGEAGLVATNALVLAMALVLAWIHLRRLADVDQTIWTLCTFAGASVVLVYIGWKMSDLVLLSLTLSGLVLSLGGRRREVEAQTLIMPFGSQSAAILGGLVLGASASMRFTTAALAAAAAVALVLDRRWRRGLVVGASAVTGFLAVSAITIALLGTANPYKTVRSSFNQRTGYPAGDTVEQSKERFETRPATQSATWRPPVDVRRSAYSTMYFFVGRHSGLLIYFPAALIFLLPILQRPDRVSMSLIAGVVGIVGFYLVWMPENYFGGSTFVGNRYFLGAFPALLVASTRLPSKRSLTAAWAVALIGWGSAVYSAYAVRESDTSSQIHAHAGVFRHLPFESTAQRIDGQAERFWAGDYVRFLDPFTTTAQWSFRLSSHRPPAELLVATDWDDQPLHFVVSPSSVEVEVEVQDWRGRWSYPVPQESPEPPGLLAVASSQPWRRHAYWWKPGKIYDARVLRFSLVGSGSEETTAVIRYAGKGRELAPLAAELVEIEPSIPTTVSSGSESVLTLVVRNTGRRPWKRSGLFPSSIGHRIIAGAQGEVVDRGAHPLPANVPSGDTLEIPVTIRWPDEAGRYQIVLDLLREPAGALKGLGRLVLAAEEVQVEPAVSPGIPAP